ncbi:hypothetical protein [Pedobacter psychroterrae]|uniref:Tissue inhibitor of metalloproteinase n=1 Tax=Pedobacter psychroterrae TaxID=2530453 RepID=A0A4R0NMW2_9SPHI|nr:hypothetical protein [Pedobacter psychroterrae]TCD01268.1 hypothetical protein EZ437_10965 [Pedobacter psychroterrae]
MTKFNIILFHALLLLSTGAYACSCASIRVEDNFQHSQFVAKAKILKITPDPKNKSYHDAEIELITLYKGEHLKKLKILSTLNSSCRFLPSVNSTWLIFASEWQGVLSFGFCSGSLNLSETFDPIKYTKAERNYRRGIALKQQVLEYLSKKKLFDPNPLHLTAFNENLEMIEGYKNKDGFAVFQVDLTTDLSIASIKILKKFQNHALTKAVFDSMKKDLTISKPENKTTANPTRMLIFCYCHQFDSGEGSVSLF